MAEVLLGNDVSKAVNVRTQETIAKLKNKDITPSLILVRVGEKEDDLTYERTILKRCDTMGIHTEVLTFPMDIDSEAFFSTIEEINNDEKVDGILVFRPLPKQLDDNRLMELSNVEKDIDGCTEASLAAIFCNKEEGFAPCTAQAVIEMLDYYHIPIEGQKAVVIGRSLVIGKPVSQLLLNRNATVTVCHSRTKDVKEYTKTADIVITALGKAESIDASYFNENSVVIDVGINWSEEKQKIVGDVLFDDAEKTVKAITPVPRGVGSVTTSILLNHVVQACLRKNKDLLK